MSVSWGGCTPFFRTLRAGGLDALFALEIEAAERFLEPLPVILQAVRRGPAHLAVGVDAGGLAGFYVVHPDRRDLSCWWLGWLAIDRRRQGEGLGRAALRSALARLARVPGCRRVRLLVAPENAVALRMYARAGFRAAATRADTGELVLEAAVADGLPTAPRVPPLTVPAAPRILAMALRLWRRGVPPAARMSGEFHGPPVAARHGLAPCPAHPHALHAAA